MTLALAKRYYRGAHKPGWHSGFCVLLILAVCSAPVSAAGLTLQRGLPDDPFYHSSDSWQQEADDQWGLKKIGYDSDRKGKKLWKNIKGIQSSVVVAIIDTGLDYFHPDFKRDNLWRNYRETANGKDDDNNGFVDDLIGWNFIDGNNNPWDRTGHGTHTAGIIAAATGNGIGIAGMNPKVKIMPLKVLNFLGRGNSSGIAEAIFYAVDNGAAIINLSLGGEYITRIEKLAVQYAVDHHVIVVVASGNTASDTSNYGFAKLDTVITVAASGLDDRRATFSNWGQDVNLTAPGVDILSLRARRTDFVEVSGALNHTPGIDFVGPEKKYYRASGTSFAAPFVSGAASLLLAANPELSAAQVTRMLLMSSDDIEEPGWDQLTGYGRLNVRSAMSADPDYETRVRVAAIQPAQVDGGVVVQVIGAAYSTDFKKAWIELGEGATPSKWKKVARINTAVREGVLANLAPADFSARGKWTVKVVVVTRKHGEREARGNIDIQ